MRLLKIVMIVLVASSLIGFIKGSRNFPLPTILPFCGGYRPGFYDVGAICLVALVGWGIWRLNHPSEDNDND